LHVVFDVLKDIKTEHPTFLLSDEQIQDIIFQGDDLYQQEDALPSQEENVSFDIDSRCTLTVDVWN
jgi:hypothetical protein